MTVNPLNGAAKGKERGGCRVLYYSVAATVLYKITRQGICVHIRSPKGCEGISIIAANLMAAVTAGDGSCIYLPVFIC